MAAGGHADPLEGVVDPEQRGRSAVDLDPPLGVPGVGEHQQPVIVGPDPDAHPGLVALLDPDGLAGRTSPGTDRSTTSRSNSG
jgi:hypothetical protein